MTNLMVVSGYTRDYPFNPSSAETVFIRQNLTSVDIRFGRIKTIPALTEIIEIFKVAVDP